MKSFDIVKWKDRLDRVVYLMDITVGNIEGLEKAWKPWKKSLDLSEDELRAKYEKIGKDVKEEIGGASSFVEYKETVKSEEYKHRTWVQNETEIFKFIMKEHKKLAKQLQSAIKVSKAKDNGTKRKEFESEIDRKFVDMYLSRHPNSTKDEAFFQVAEDRGKSFEAIKYNYYYTPKMLEK